MYNSFEAKASQQEEGNINFAIHTNTAGLSGFTRESAGLYRATLPVGVTVEQDDFLYQITNGQTSGKITAYMDDSTVVIASFDTSGQSSDGIIDNATINLKFKQ
jgi:hypothetical protein